MKENKTADPSSNVMNYAKFTGVLANSIALKQYLEDQKILLQNNYVFIYMASVALMTGGALLSPAATISLNTCLVAMERPR